MAVSGSKNGLDTPGPRTRIDIAIEALTLIALILVPLVFRGREWVSFFSQPKFFVLHFVALAIAVLWLFELAIDFATNEKTGSGSLFERVDVWLSGGRHRWAVIAAVGFGVAFVISTLLSPLPGVSVWGRDFGDLGYELYSTLSYLVIFLAVALRTRTSDQLLRIVMIIAAVGTISASYGVSQAYGWDPIGRGENLGRVIASYGNPLFLAAYLVMAIPIVAAVALIHDSRGRSWVLGPGAIAIGLQLAALWFAGGRGAWIASVVGLLAFVLFSLKWLGHRRAMRATSLTVCGAVVALVIVVAPGGTNENGRGLEELGDVAQEIVDGFRYLVQGRDWPAPPSLADAADTEEFGAFDPQSTAIGNRADIWRGALQLAVSRERVEDESGLVRGFRFLFGYGPDMYFYSFPIESRPLPRFEANSHAHNYPLQVLLEQGLAGLLALIATAALVVISAISVIRRISRSEHADPWLAILMIGVLAALVARAVEQIAGVGKVSDLVTFWALMGLVIAVAEIEMGPFARKRQGGRFVLSTSGFQKLAPIGAVILASIVALVIFVQKDVNPLRAGWISADGFEQKRAGDSNSAFSSFQEANDLAPDVERYYTEIAGFLSRTATANNDDSSVGLLISARQTLLEYEERDPFAWRTKLDLASIASALTSRGNSDFIPEVVNRYLDISAAMEPYPTIQSTAAENILLVGEYEVAVIVAERAIALEATTGPLPSVWWVLGESLFQLDRIDDAEFAWETSLRRLDTGVYAARSHRGLAFVNELRGNSEMATKHHQKADELEAR